MFFIPTTFSALSTLSTLSSTGLKAAQTQFQASAQSIARFSLPGAGGNESGPGSAVTGTSAAPSFQRPPKTASLETDLVGLLQAKNAFLVNLTVFKASDEMSGTLLDTFS